MSEQDGIQPSTLQPPTSDDPRAWIAYWRAQGQPWRIEPEIDLERQKYLTKRRSIPPDIEKGIYPFRDIQLTRADVEWLLATHESGGRCGPVDWSDEHQRDRDGLDLRGADLRSLNLSRLPLARMSGGINFWSYGTFEQHEAGLAHLEGVSLINAHLEDAHLQHVYLENADLSSSYLKNADLYRANLKGAWLAKAQLQNTNLSEAHLEGASLDYAQLDGASLRNAYFDHVTRLRAINFGNEKSGIAKFSDIHWGEANLAMVDWMQVNLLGDEFEALQMKRDGKAKENSRRVYEHEVAVRANRQIATALQSQGLNEVALRFSYRAQVLQRKVLWLQTIWGIEVVEWREKHPQDEPVLRERNLTIWQKVQKFGRYLFSLLLDILAGYGYKPVRSIIAYLVIIFGFMGLFLFNAHFVAPHLRWDEALVLSVSSFHGRGFFSQTISLGDTYARLAALEAVLGLFIEISFIATFTKRFLGS